MLDESGPRSRGWVSDPKSDRGTRPVVRCRGIRCGNEGFKNALQGLGRTRPAAGERFAMNRQFADDASRCMRVKVDVEAIGNPGQRNRQTTRRRCESQAGLFQPVRDQNLQVLAAARALDVSLACQRGMPSKNFQMIEPTVLHYQKPSLVPEGDKAADGAGQAFCNRAIHFVPLRQTLGLLGEPQAIEAPLFRRGEWSGFRAWSRSAR